jgi:hypothetical protein
MGKKTFKRETAWAFMLILGYIVYIENIALLQVVIWPFMLFIGTSYGMDWATKQTDFTKRGKE